MGSYTDWLRTRDDDQLTRLLRRRPYLAAPTPGSFASLAGRAASRSATQRALAEVDALGLQVLRAALVLGTGTSQQVVEAVLGADPDPDDPARVAAAVADLVTAALVWPDGEALHPAPGIAALLDPDGQHRTARPIPPDRPGRAVPPDRPGRAVPPDRPGRAVPPDGRLFRTVARPPRPAPTAVPVPTVAAESARAAQGLVTAVERLVEAWADPPPVLRRGGLGMRDLRRTAQALGTTVADAAFVVELAAAASLVVADLTGPTAAFVPTTAADPWLARPLPDRWAVLARAWATSARAAWLVGTKDDRDAVRTAVHPDGWRPWLPRLRRAVLTVLADVTLDDADPSLVGALTADQVREVLAWRTPLAVPPLDVVTPLLAEAARLGVTGAGALSQAGRALLADSQVPGVGPDNRVPAVGPDNRVPAVGPDGDCLEPVAAALAADLPPPVDEVWLQADLTGVVPGRPSDPLARLLRRAAREESSGGALTVRFTPESVAAAVAATSADDVLAELTRVSRGPVPQGLEYLVRDAARRHDALRTGPARTPHRARPRPPAPSREPTLADVRAAVARLRADPQPAPGTPAPTDDRHRTEPPDRLAPGPPADPLDTLMVLREAVDRRTETWVDLVDDTGRTARHRLRPLAVHGGRLRAVDPARAVEITVAIHRIAAAALVAAEP